MEIDDCLLGYTGFVGQTLMRQRQFAGLYNSSNVDALLGRRCSTLICAAAPGAMWAANENPRADKANLERICNAVKQVKADRVILISTIAVFDKTSAGYTETNARYEVQKPYGRHRREMEVELTAYFKNFHIVRLPALFGYGIRKNFIFDLLNPAPSFLRTSKFDEAIKAIHPKVASLLRSVYRFNKDFMMWELDRLTLEASGERPLLERAFRDIDLLSRNFTNSGSRFQYYNMARLSADIDWMVRQDISSLNICSEPLQANELCVALTREPFNNDAPPLIEEDIHSDHAAQFGANAPYLYNRASVLDDLKAFFVSEATS